MVGSRPVTRHQREVLRVDRRWLVTWLASFFLSLGILAGTAGAYAAARLVSTMLFGLSATDPLTYAVVAVALVAIALFAALLPARRASRIDPNVALRLE